MIYLIRILIIIIIILSTDILTGALTYRQVQISQLHIHNSNGWHLDRSKVNTYITDISTGPLTSRQVHRHLDKSTAKYNISITKNNNSNIIIIVIIKYNISITKK
jgi:hypothetical protein